MKVAIVNIDVIVTGDWREPFAAGNTIITEDGKIAFVGDEPANLAQDCDVVIDAAGATVIPGLIDSQIHNTFGDYTPRQKTVGFLESYVHSGTTTSISASEVHVPGRPKDPEGVKALAVAAMKCFEHYRPGGMRVHAGSIILEPGLVEADFAEIAARRFAGNIGEQFPEFRKDRFIPFLGPFDRSIQGIGFFRRCGSAGLSRSGFATRRFFVRFRF